MSNLCRVCLNNGDLLSIFECIESIPISEKIMSCTSVKIAPGDELPSRICLACIQNLNTSYNFKIQCENSDSKLREQFYTIVEKDSEILTEQKSIKHNFNDLKIKIDIEDTQNDSQLIVKPKKSKKKKSVKKKELVKEKYEITLNCDKIDHLITTQKIEPSNDSIQDNEIDNSGNFSNLEANDNSDRSYSPVGDDETQRDLCLDQDNKKGDHPEKSDKTSKKSKPNKEQCFTCGKVMSSRFRLKMHMRIHTGERPFKCAYCPKHFSLAQNLKVHERTHTGEKPLLCGSCGKGFAQYAGLITHTRLHTGQLPYKCKLCPQSFRTTGHLQYHIRKHTGEKNFECGVCQRAFITRGDLTQHTKTHTGERRFICPLCGMRMTRASHLTRHMLTHSGEKPHRCSVCGSAYAQKGDLLRHEKKHSIPSVKGKISCTKINRGINKPLPDMHRITIVDNAVNHSVTFRPLDSKNSIESKEMVVPFGLGIFTTPDN